MPRYYFHIKRGQVVMLDQEGLEFSGMAVADKEATRRGQKTAAHVLPAITTGGHLSMTMGCCLGKRS